MTRNRRVVGLPAVLVAPLVRGLGAGAVLPVSITITVPSAPFDTYTSRPDGCTLIPFERTPAGIVASTFRVGTSIA